MKHHVIWYRAGCWCGWISPWHHKFALVRFKFLWHAWRTKHNKSTMVLRERLEGE